MNEAENDDISPEERAQIERVRQEIAAGTFRPKEGEADELAVTDRAKGVRMIDPTDRFVFTHSPNGDIHMLDTEPPVRGVGGAIQDDEGEPQDEDQRDDHPFAISVLALGYGTNGEANQWKVTVLGGTYATGDGTPIAVDGGDYPTVVLDETQYRAPSVGQLPVKTVALLFVPVEPCNEGDTGAVKCTDGRYARAITGGVVYLSSLVPAGFPSRIINPLTSTPGFFVHLGTWTSRYAEEDVGGTPTRKNRVSVSQLVTDDVVLDAESDATSPRAFVQSLSVSGAVPTSSEIATALQSVSWDTVPLLGDTVELQVSGTTKFRATVCPTVTPSGLFAVSFTVSSITYYAQLVQTGHY